MRSKAYISLIGAVLITGALVFIGVIGAGKFAALYFDHNSIEIGYLTNIKSSQTGLETQSKEALAHIQQTALERQYCEGKSSKSLATGQKLSKAERKREKRAAQALLLALITLKAKGG